MAPIGQRAMPKLEPAKTCTHEVVSGVLVSVHAPLPPTDPEWDDYLELVKQLKAQQSLIKVLVIAEHGPNAMQRARLTKVTEGIKMRAAVVTDSAVVRGIMMAFSWMGKIDLRGFHPSDLDKAYAFLEVPQGEHSKIADRIDAMSRELGVSKT